MTARKILIVDDDPDLREALMEQLSLTEEFEPLEAETATKACSPPARRTSTSS